jgi:hypothetical protein
MKQTNKKFKTLENLNLDVASNFDIRYSDLQFFD